MSDQATHPTGQAVAEIVRQARETTGPTLAERQAVHAGHPEGQPGGCRAADLSLADLMADFEPTDGARQEYEALAAAYAAGQRQPRAGAAPDYTTQVKQIIDRYRAVGEVRGTLADVLEAAILGLVAAAYTEGQRHPDAQTVAEIVRQARETTGPTLAERQAVHAGHPEGQPGGCRAADLSLADLMADFEPTDRARQEYEQLLAAPPPHREGEDEEVAEIGFDHKTQAVVVRTPHREGAEGQRASGERDRQLTQARILLDRARLSLEPECGRDRRGECGENCELRRQIHEFLWPAGDEGAEGPQSREAKCDCGHLASSHDLGEGDCRECSCTGFLLEFFDTQKQEAEGPQSQEGAAAARPNLLNKAGREQFDRAEAAEATCASQRAEIEKLERHLGNLSGTVKAENEQLQALAEKISAPKPTDRQGYTGQHTPFSVIASQQAIIAALPKTADGVPIVPGMTVYCLVGPHVDERQVIAPYGQKALLTREPAQHGTCGGDCHRLAETVYADRQRAKAAQSAPPPEGGFEV